jgi:hypothetical protein
LEGAAGRPDKELGVLLKLRPRPLRENKTTRRRSREAALSEASDRWFAWRSDEALRRLWEPTKAKLLPAEARADER